MPVIGYDKASKIAHHAMDNDLTRKAVALQLGFVAEAEFDSVVDPRKMVKPMWGGTIGDGRSGNIPVSVLDPFKNARTHA